LKRFHRVSAKISALPCSIILCAYDRSRYREQGSARRHPQGGIIELAKRMKTSGEILEKLETGDFDALIGVMETEWLDAKRTPYHLGTQKQKLELAQGCNGNR
jgi:hypothetical protein